MTPLENKMLSALLVQSESDNHFSSCQKCEVGPEGDVRECDRAIFLKERAVKLRKEAIEKAMKQ